MSDMAGKENYRSKRIRSIYRTDTQGKSNDTGTASSLPESHRQSCQPLGEGNGISGYPDPRTFGRGTGRYFDRADEMSEDVAAGGKCAGY